jgi:hypothetical protein
MLQLSSHDEGSCFVPSVLRNATVLSHWGNVNLNNASHSNYDNYYTEYTHPSYQPEGSIQKLGLFPCHDPTKVSAGICSECTANL